MAESIDVTPIRVMRVIARMNVGGPAVQIAGLMRELEAPEFEQILVAGYCADDEADYIETQAPDITCSRLQGLGRAIDVRDDMKALASLVGLIRRFDPHIVHTHTAKAGILGRAAARISAKQAKLVHTYHGHLLHGYFSPAKTGAVIALERTLAKRTNRLVAVGDQVRDDLLSAGIGRPEQYDVVAPGLALEISASREDARALLGLDDRPVISFIGRLTTIKRPDRFIQAAAIVHSRGHEVQFLVAGDGSESEAMSQAIDRERLPIRMLGWRSDIDVILAASDAVILTSDNEGTPISLIQAALAGLPVIACNVGSVKDVVTDGQTGWLTEPDPAALADAIVDLLMNPRRGRILGTQAREQARVRYGVQRLAHDYARIYRKLLGL